MRITYELGSEIIVYDVDFDSMSYRASSMPHNIYGLAVVHGRLCYDLFADQHGNLKHMMRARDWTPVNPNHPISRAYDAWLSSEILKT